VKTDIAGVDDQMFSDTLFGHEKGAFTGAISDRRGLIEQASGGTLFLDEIGHLGAESQHKLLRFLQEGEYYPLGRDEAKTSDVATNRTIEFLIAGGTFREDLYFRLRTHHIHLPPLRERNGDIPLLVSHFLKQSAAALNKKTPTPPPELFTLLKTHHFPGNIRELEAMVHDAVSQHEGGALSTESFREAMDEQTSKLHKNTAIGTEEVRFVESLARARDLPSLKEVEPLVIEEALRRADGNQTIAARLLDISKQALNKRLSRARKSTDKA
ncbi:MAG: sigma 54-interacting transcriptional regulator, partial [Candidatus Poribacteria bacterium]|nr:sigma 54-interacting transcriptional regulator [Candidatus Poribacteria bacterium]